MSDFIKSFSDYIPVSNSLEHELLTRTQSLELKKGELIHSADQVCSKSYFIESGILRLYFLKGGKEVTEYFCSTNEWINSPRSFIQQTPDIYYIDVIEDATVTSIHVKDLVYLFDNFTEMDRHARLTMGVTFGHIMDRITSMRFTTAREKYDHFLNTYPQIHHRLPLGMIASYIGVAQETLSRLRHE